MEQEILLDAGYSFGMGVFETIAVEKGSPLFLPWHLERLRKGLDVLGIVREDVEQDMISRQITEYLSHHFMEHGVLKIMVSESNLLFQTRENSYKAEDYKRGFRLDISRVIRNETSPFTYIKSLQYGDNLLEKRRAKQEQYDETLFLNSRGQIAETSASNIFFVKDGKLYTPSVDCGILPGIVRRYVLEHYRVEERRMMPEELGEFQEAFLTNSLMGIMPIESIGDYIFKERETAERCMKAYDSVRDSSYGLL